MGRIPKLIMVNSTWTKNHIISRWKPKESILHTVYPPVNCSAFKSFPLEDRTRLVVSVGQFRPEKNHALQVESFRTFLERDPERYGDIKFTIIGGVREHKKGDKRRVERLQKLIEDYGLQESISLEVNASFDFICDSLYTATAGIHTMKHEHFGISVVELMVLFNILSHTRLLV